MITAALCPLHRTEDLDNLRQMVAHQTQRTQHVLLFLNGEARWLPDQAWADTYRGDVRNVSEARNELLAIARAYDVDWGFFLDADDYYSPYWFELNSQRAATLGASAFGLNSGWTSYDGRLLRFSGSSELVPLGGTLAVRVRDALDFDGDIGEEIEWSINMRNAGHQVIVLNDTRGYCYVRRTGKGTAHFTLASLRRARGNADDFGFLPPACIDSDPMPVTHLPRPSMEETSISEVFHMPKAYLRDRSAW